MSKLRKEIQQLTKSKKDLEKKLIAEVSVVQKKQLVKLVNINLK